ncbi:MAG: neocarzinostatin apoprotein domain-containing protein [Acidimicrobiia bacterium]
MATLLATLAAPTAAPTGAAGPTLTVTPDSGLHQDDPVEVAATGFDSGTRPAVVEWCPLTGGACRYGISHGIDDDGTFSTEITAQFRAAAPDGADSDCNVEGCELRVSQRRADGTTLVLTAPVEFAPDQAPLDPQDLAVDPATDLRDPDVVTVTGRGFSPDFAVDTVQECALAVGVCRLEPARDIAVAPDGSFSTPFAVRRYITSRWAPPVDCAVEACVLLADQLGDLEITLTTPIGFDAAAPASPLPTATVTPHTGLGPETPATVSGTHFAAGEPVDVHECDVASFAGPCANLGSFPADAGGGVTGDVVLLRVVGTAPAPQVDCVDPATRCVAVVEGRASGEVATVALEFSDSQPLADVTVVPSTELPYRGYVTVVGHHLQPGTEYDAAQCYPGGTCGPGSRGVADTAGELELTVLVRRIGFGTPTEVGIPRIDCLATDCAVRFSRTSGPSIDSRLLPLLFDPAAAVPPPPVISADPSTDLPFRTDVHVTGSGFLERSTVSITQCGTGVELGPCGTPTTVVADDHGAIDAVVPVRRVLGNAVPVLDCAVAPATCELRAQGVGADDTERATTPVAFDPTTLPPPPPPIAVSPTTGLTDGATVHVRGTGFPAHDLVAVILCTADATSPTAGCDLTTPFTFGSTDAAGTFGQDVTVHTTITVGGIPVDCAAAPGRCGVGAIAASDGTTFSVVPITFGSAGPPHHHHRHHHRHRHHHHQHRHHHHHHDEDRHHRHD